MTNNNTLDDNQTEEESAGKPYEYTGELAGTHETRSEAIGEVTKTLRRRIESRHNRSPTPEEYKEAISRVYGYEPHICGYCLETFLHESQHDDHQPCPHWQEANNEQPAKKA